MPPGNRQPTAPAIVPIEGPIGLRIEPTAQAIAPIELRIGCSCC